MKIAIFCLFVLSINIVLICLDTFYISYYCFKLQKKKIYKHWKINSVKYFLILFSSADSCFLSTTYYCNQKTCKPFAKNVDALFVLLIFLLRKKINNCKMTFIEKNVTVNQTKNRFNSIQSV